MTFTRVAIVSVALLVPGSVLLAAPVFTDMAVFGDSLSDVGNVSDLALNLYPFPPYWPGRFTNGPVWVEWMGGWLGLDAGQPSRKGGSNYAFGGAETGWYSPAIPSFLGQWGMTTQTVLYAADHQGAPAPDTLFVLWGGGNDFFNGQDDPWAPAVYMAVDLLILNAYGAEHALVANLPPLGQTPRYLGTAEEALMDQRTTQYNQNLDAVLNWVEVACPDLTIYRYDVHGFFDQLLADPGAYGLTNVTDPAYDEGSGQVVPNVDEYLFWDTIHPSRMGHLLLGLGGLFTLAASSGVSAGQVLPAGMVPEPATMGLLAAGCCVLLAARRKRLH